MSADIFELKTGKFFKTPFVKIFLDWSSITKNVKDLQALQNRTLRILHFKGNRYLTKAIHKC